MLPTDKNVATRMRGVRLVSRILLALQVVSLGHLLTVRHATCPEHGDVIHLEHSIEAPTAPDVGLPGGSPTIAAAPVAIEGDHDHCQACTETNRRSAVLRPSAPILKNLAVAVHPPCSSKDAVFAPIDLILLSPKSSPPTV